MGFGAGMGCVKGWLPTRPPLLESMLCHVGLFVLLLYDDAELLQQILTILSYSCCSSFVRVAACPALPGLVWFSPTARTRCHDGFMPRKSPAKSFWGSWCLAALSLFGIGTVLKLLTGRSLGDHHVADGFGTSLYDLQEVVLLPKPR